MPVKLNAAARLQAASRRYVVTEQAQAEGPDDSSLLALCPGTVVSVSSPTSRQDWEDDKFKPMVFVTPLTGALTKHPFWLTKQFFDRAVKAGWLNPA